MQIQLISALDRNQVRITAAFTDVEALKNWDPKSPYLGLKAQDLFRAVMASDIQELAINPFDPSGKMIRPGGRVKRTEMELLADGIVPSFTGPKTAQFDLKAGQKVFIGLPANPPSPMIQQLLKNKADSLASIEELYVFQIATETGGSHTVIGIVASGLAKAQVDEIAKSMQMSVRTELKTGQSLDFMFLSGSMRDQVKAFATPLFRRP
jgi:hypothetical protein